MENFFRGSKKIFGAYVFATFIYFIAHFHYFDMYTFLKHLCLFNISEPFYYVLLYLQLMLISRSLYLYIKRDNSKFFWKELVMFMIILACSHFTVCYTNILNVYGGGGRLFGGTYLILFYLGMLSAKHDVFKKRGVKKLLVIWLIAVVAFVFWIKFLCINYYSIDKYLPYGDGTNPPSISLFVMTMMVVLFCYGFFSFCEEIFVLKKVTTLTNYIGRHTLFVFLFHKLFIDYCLVNITFTNMLVKRIVYFFIIIAGSFFFELIYNTMKKYSYNDRNK